MISILSFFLGGGQGDSFGGRGEFVDCNAAGFLGFLGFPDANLEPRCGLKYSIQTLREFHRISFWDSLWILSAISFWNIERDSFQILQRWMPRFLGINLTTSFRRCAASGRLYRDSLGVWVYASVWGVWVCMCVCVCVCLTLIVVNEVTDSQQLIEPEILQRFFDWFFKTPFPDVYEDEYQFHLSNWFQIAATMNCGFIICVPCISGVGLGRIQSCVTCFRHSSSRFVGFFQWMSVCVRVCVFVCVVKCWFALMKYPIHHSWLSTKSSVICIFADCTRWWLISTI